MKKIIIAALQVATFDKVLGCLVQRDRAVETTLVTNVSCVSIIAIDDNRNNWGT